MLLIRGLTGAPPVVAERAEATPFKEDADETKRD
jgi:hypothetical protein